MDDEDDLYGDSGRAAVQLGENSQIQVYGRVRPSNRIDQNSFKIDDGRIVVHTYGMTIQQITHTCFL